MTKVRTRFAPSPTGHLHVGGSRTALFCYLFARRHKGSFILRIDDTDPERSSKEMETVILEGLKWLGLTWDEGPFYQSQRSDIYGKAVEKLLDAGHLYRCNCPPDLLEKKREAALAKNENPRYDGACRNRKDILAGDPHVLRFKAPLGGETVIDDEIQGTIVFPNSELDDLVIKRTDGTYTYNFCTVVDDIDMNITHIIRGTDHLNNTHRQLAIFRAVGGELPKFAHMPLTLGPDKTKLSKRHGDTALLAYRDKGFLAEAMVNYMVRLGWSHGDREIFTIDELIDLFDLPGCTKSPGIFDIAKLTWVNEQHIQKKNAADIGRLLAGFLRRNGIEAADEDEKLEHIAASLMPRSKTLLDMAAQAQFYFKAPETYEEKADRKNFKPEAVQPLDAILKKLPDGKLDKEKAIEIVHGVADELKVKLGLVAQPLRVALTGVAASPGIDEVMVILGPAEIRSRVEKAITFIKNKQGA